MGSKKAELYQISVGRKRKKLNARTFKDLFKRQRIKEGLPDVDGKLEEPNNMSHICNGNGRGIKSKPIGEGEVSDECCKRLKGNLRHLSIDKASGGDLQKSIVNLRRADAEILGCSITKYTNTAKSGSADCMARAQHVDPSIVLGELTELQGTHVAASKEGIYTITASNLTESLQIASISSNDAPISMSGQNSFGAEVGTGEPDKRFPSLSEQNNRNNIMRVELNKLCQILKVSEDVTLRVGEFLEHVFQNHDVSSDSPATMQAFQLSVCWIASLISKQKVDKKYSFNLAKKQLNYQCTEEQVYSVYSKMRPLDLTYFQCSENVFDSGKACMLADEDSNKEPSHLIDGASLFSLFTENNERVEIEEIVEKILKQKLGMNIKAAGSEIHDKIKKTWKKCDKRMKTLDRKQEEEVQGLLRTWEEEKVKLEKDHKLESSVTCFIHGEGSGTTSKLKLLDDKFAKKMEEHNLLKDMQLNSLKEKQLAARNEVRQKADDWLAEAIAYASKLGTVNGPQSFGSQFENGPECTGSGTHIMRTGHENVVTVFQERAEYPNTYHIEVVTSKMGDAVTLVQSNHAVPITGNCKQLNHFSADASLVCNQYPAREIEHQNRDQETNFSLTVAAGENEEFSHEFVSQGIENLHHNQLDPGQQASRISHEQNVEFVRSPDNRVMSESVSTTELPNQSVPQSGIDAGNLHGSKNDDAEMTRSTCVQVSQNESHPVASAEQENRGTPAAEIQNTSQTEVQSDVVTLVQLNHAVQVTGNYEQLGRLSVDASLICNQSLPNEIEHHNRDQVTNFSQTVAAGETEEFSHEFVSQSSENLHHNRLDMGQASRISREQSVEVFVRSPDNTVMAEAASTTELPNQSVPQLGIDAVHLRGTSHLLVHPTHPVASWNSTPSLVAEPLQNELEKLWKEAELSERMHRNVVSQLKSDCEKKIQEIINQIHTKHDMKLKDAEAEFRLKKNELEKNKNLVLMNTRLAEGFRSKFQCRPLQLQQVFPSSFEQYLPQPSQPPPMRISSLASASQPPPTQQTLAPSAQALNQLYMPTSARSSPVSIRNVTASPPIQAMQRAGSVLSGTSARSPVVASITPAANPRIADFRSRAPRLQPFLPAAAPSMAPSSFSAIPQLHPQPLFPSQLVPTPRTAPPHLHRPPPQLMPRLSKLA